MKHLFIPLILLGCHLSAFAEEAKDKEQDTRPFCKTVEESAQWVFKQCAREFTLQIARTPRSGLILHHLGFGMWIRNNVPVWHNKTLQQSVGKDVHPDDVGGLILKRYQEMARAELPEGERQRIEYFETTIAKLNHWQPSRPTGKTHADVIRQINKTIQAVWPKDAPHKPYLLKMATDASPRWEPDNMGNNLENNIAAFILSHDSMPFYRGDYLCVGDPEK